MGGGEGDMDENTPSTKRLDRFGRRRIATAE